MDLSMTEAREVGRIMARDGVSMQEALDLYFGVPWESTPDAGRLSPETVEAISRKRREEQEELSD